VEESKALNDGMESKIIISASGMCDAGRVRHHLKHNLWRRESTVLFVGFQAQGTLGRQIVDGARQVKLFGEDIRVNAHIEMIEGFSGHADREGLLSWIGAFSRKPSKIILIHGEDEIISKFAEAVKQRFNIPTEIPDFGESILLGLPAASTNTEVTASATAAPVVNERKRAVFARMDDMNAGFSAHLAGLKADLLKAASISEIEAISGKIKEYEDYLSLYQVR